MHEPAVRGDAIIDRGPVTLERSYRLCRDLHRRHGTTYYWATMVLPRVKRHHVHALYGLCRHADEIVDAVSVDTPPGPAMTRDRAAALGRLEADLERGLAERHSGHPVLKAVVHTALAFDLPPELFERFFASMAMDLTVERYGSFEDLQVYMDGSAAVIGEMMLPILEPADTDAARSGARALGVAFQLTNFLRDVGEDLDRGRVYLPQDELGRFGADPSTRRVDDAWRQLCRFQIARIRAIYSDADHGIDLLAGRSAASIRAARVLYAEILDRIEAQDYDVFSTRARVPLARKLTVAARSSIGL